MANKSQPGSILHTPQAEKLLKDKAVNRSTSRNKRYTRNNKRNGISNTKEICKS